jgi:hypothetical protein
MSTGTPAPAASAPRFGARASLGLALGFTLLGGAYSWPLALHLTDGLPFAAVPPAGRETPVLVQGDYLQFYYYLWLVRDRVAAGASFLVDPYQFAVDGPRPNLPNTFLPAALLYLPLAFSNPRLGYNLLVLLSFPLSGLAACLLAHRYGIPRGAAALAGVVFACAPYRVGALLGGHPAGLAYPLVPLALWGLEGALAGSLAGAAWAAGALVAVSIMEPHFFYFAALGLPAYLLVRVALTGWDARALRIGAGATLGALALAVAPAAGALAALAGRGWRPAATVRMAVGLIVGVSVLSVWQALAGWLVASGAVPDPRAAARRSLLGCLPWLLLATAGTRLGRLAAVAGGLPFLIHAAWLARSPGARRLPLRPMILTGLGAGGGAAFLFLLRQLLLRRSVSGAGRTLQEVLLFSPLPADLAIRANPSAGRAIYPGVVALAAAILALLALARRPPTGRRSVLLAYGPLLGLALVLSLGPRLTALPLFEAAFLLVPSWNFIRQPAKFQVVAGLALAVLAAAGAAALVARWRSRTARVAAVGLLALAVAVDYHPWRPAGVSLVPSAGPVHAKIRDNGPRALYLPLWPGDSSYSGIYLYATTLTGIPMLNGYSAWLDRSYLTDVYRPLEAANLGTVGEMEHAALVRYGVRQVVFDRDAFPVKVSPFGPAFTRAALRTSPFLDLARAAGDESPLWIFRVRDQARISPAPSPTSAVGVYWEAESLLHETGEVVDDPEASNGRVVRAVEGRDRPAFLQYGPYRLLPPGAFRARYRLRGSGAGVELQVTTAGGRQLLGATSVTLEASAGRQEAEVAFTTDRVTAVEYRARWDGRGTVELDAVHVVFAGVPDPAPGFEVDDLPHELAERSDPDARSGFAAHADPLRTPRDIVWAGPTRRYPVGRYRLWVRLKVDSPASIPVAWCGAQLASRGAVVGGRELEGAELATPGRYVELAVPFTLTAPSVLDFPCLYRGAVGTWFDHLRVEGPLTP